MSDGHMVKFLVKRQLEPELHQLPADTHSLALEVVDKLCQAYHAENLHVLANNLEASQQVARQIEANTNQVSDAEENLRLAIETHGFNDVVATQKAHQFVQAAEEAYVRVVKKNFLDNAIGGKPEIGRC